MPKDLADVCIIGGGIVGLFTGLECLRAGLTVRLIDKIYVGASRYNIGDVLLQGHEDSELPFIKYTYDAWCRAAEEYGEELGFEKRGSVFLNYDEADLVRCKSQSLIAQAQGLDTRYFEGQEAITEYLQTELADDVLGGQFSADDGIVDTGVALDGLRRKFVQLGGKVWGSDEVREIVVRNGKVTGAITTAGDECEAKHTVLIAGVWSSKLLKPLNISIPLRPARSHVIQLSSTRKIPKPMIARRFASGDIVIKYQPRNGRILAAYSGAYDQEQATWATQVDPQAIAWLHKEATHILPCLQGASVKSMHTTSLAMTPDKHACFGLTPQLEGFGVAVGFAGRSYAFAPGVAKILAAQLSGLTSTIDTAIFSPQRFA